jgi:hypothetical protein
MVLCQTQVLSSIHEPLMTNSYIGPIWTKIYCVTWIPYIGLIHTENMGPDYDFILWGAGIAHWYSTRLQAGWLGIWVLARAGNFLFTTTSTLALGPTQPPIQWVPEALSLGQVMKLTTHLHLAPRSRICGAIPPLPQYAFIAWCSVKAQGRLYLYLSPPNYLGKFVIHVSPLLPIHYIKPNSNFYHISHPAQRFVLWVQIPLRIRIFISIFWWCPVEI